MKYYCQECRKPILERDVLQVNGGVPICDECGYNLVFFEDEKIAGQESAIRWARRELIKRKGHESQKKIQVRESH